MSGRTESPFVAHAIANSFAIAQEFCNTIETIKGEAEAVRLLVIANIFSILLDTLKNLRFDENFEAVQISTEKVLSLKIPNQPQIISVQDLELTKTSYLSFGHLKRFGIKSQFTGLQSVLQN